MELRLSLTDEPAITKFKELYQTSYSAFRPSVAVHAVPAAKPPTSKRDDLGLLAMTASQINLVASSYLPVVEDHTHSTVHQDEASAVNDHLPSRLAPETHLD
jgi:hypothetical protein